MRARPLLFVVLPALMWLPFDMLSELVSQDTDDLSTQFRNANRIGNLGSLIVGTLLMSTFAFTLRELAAGRQPSLAASFGGGQAFWGRTIGASFLAGVLGVLATLLLVIPGIYVFVCWALIVPVIVFEELRGMEALRRSRALVQSRGFFTVLGYSLAFYVVYVVLSFIPAVAVGAIDGLTETPSHWFINALTSMPLNVVLSALTIGATLLYVDASGTPAQWPVGTDLVNSDGNRLPAPRSTGRPALAIASIAAAAMLLVMTVMFAVAVQEGLAEEGLDAFVD